MSNERGNNAGGTWWVWAVVVLVAVLVFSNRDAGKEESGAAVRSQLGDAVRIYQKTGRVPLPSVSWCDGKCNTSRSGHCRYHAEFTRTVMEMSEPINLP